MLKLLKCFVSQSFGVLLRAKPFEKLHGAMQKQQSLNNSARNGRTTLKGLVATPTLDSKSQEDLLHTVERK
eukprot:4786190-Amphidinium_carterae.1